MILCWTLGQYMIYGQYIIHCFGHVGIVGHMVGTCYMGNAWHLLKVPKSTGTTQLHGIYKEVHIEMTLNGEIWK